MRRAGVILLVLAVAAPALCTGGNAPSGDGDVGDGADGIWRALPALEVFCQNNTTVVKAGEAAVYEIGVRNNGNGTEEVRLSAVGTPGWSWSGWNGTMTIPPGNVTGVRLEVRPAPDALGGDVGVVAATAASTSDANLTGTLETFSTVAEELGIRVGPEQNETNIMPGGTAVCNISVGKTGNSRRPLFLEALVNVPGWVAALDTVQVNLEGAGVSTVALEVRAPPDARGGLKAPVNVSCRDRDRTVEAGCTAFFVVVSAGNVTVRTAPETAVLGPGGNAGYVLELTNSGNGDEEVRPGNCTLPAGWSVGFYPNATRELNGSVLVPFGGAGRMDVALGAAANASSGEYRFAGELLGSLGGRYGFTLGARVRREPGVDLEAAQDRRGGAPGGTASFWLNVTNTGDGAGNLTMTAIGLPRDWPAVEFRLDGKALGAGRKLGPQDSVLVEAVVGIPAGTDEERVVLGVVASLSGGGRDSLELALEVQRSDLRIVRLELPKERPKAGAPEHLDLTVGNAGNADAENVTLALLVNGRELIVLDIGGILAGEERVEGVLWVPAKGKNLLRFVIGSKNALPERNATNNEVTAYRTAPAAETGGEPNRFLVPALAAAIAIGVGAAAAALRIRKRK